MIRLVSTDFDGTIFDQTEITPEFLNWIGSAQEKGLKWIINTGREYDDLNNILKVMGVEVFPDYIVSVERHIHQRENGSYIEYSDWNDICRDEHEQLFERTKDLMYHIREGVNSRFNVGLYEDEWSPLCILAASPSDADSIHEWIESESRLTGALSLVRNGPYFRFSHRLYTKGTALSEVARLLDIPKSKIFAAGDHYNDLPMLDGSHAEMVAAPDNAIPEVKQLVRKAGGYVSSEEGGLGVLDALKYFLKTK